VVRIDLEDSIQLESICMNIDLVIHAAGMNAKDCMLNPVEAIKINGLATSTLLEAAKKKGVRKMIYFSTAHVYANPLEGIISEECRPMNLHPYATSNRIGEDFVLTANLDSDFKGFVLRLSNCFGVPTSASVNCWMLLINDLCRQAIEVRSLNLSSNGMQVRNFISMSKVCQVIDVLVSKLETDQNDNVNGGIYNLGGNRSMSTYEMAQFIQSRCKLLLGFTPEINRLIPPNNTQPTELDYLSEKIQKLLGPIEEDYESEVDQLLIYCNNNFNKSENPVN
jgi:UDP-glucose 4-epimerase